MQIELLHHKLEQVWNKLSNNHVKYLTDIDKDEVLNAAIFEYVEMFSNGKNLRGYDIGFEVTEQRIEMLKTLVVSFPEQELLNCSKVGENIYAIDLTKTRYPFRSFRRGSLNVKECSSIVYMNVEQHHDLDDVLLNTHRRSSLNFQRAVVTLRGDKIYIYTSGEFEPLTADITYIRKPATVCIGTYPAIENRNNPLAPNKAKVDCDLPDDYADILIAIAKGELDRRYGDINGKNLQTEKIVSLT